MSIADSDYDGDITIDALKRLYNKCLETLRDGELRALRNDAKLRAISNTKSYDEFKDIVEAAHLKPITRYDKMNAVTKNRLWNKAACESNDI